MDAIKKNGGHAKNGRTIAKKILIFCFTIAFMLLINGCGAGSSANSSTDNAPSEANTASDANAPIGMENIKVGVIANYTKEDGGWTQSHYAAVMAMKENLKLEDSQLVWIEDVPDSGSEAATALERLASGGCNIIFSTSSGFYDATAESAEKHPDIKYLFFNGPFEDNLSSYAIRDYEALFVNGYLAAKMAPSGKLGFVAAQPEASVVRAINGFADGVKYANPDATIQVLWVNSWYDPVKEMESAKSLLAAGAEVLGHHSSSPAVEQAAEEAGKYVVGFHVDMRQYAPNANLTSFLWNWEPIFSDAVRSVASGTWTAQNYFWGTEKNCAAIAPINETIVPPELIAEVNALKDKISAKEILVFQGPLSDNHGNEIVAAGSVIEDDKLKDMGFLLSNVVGELP